MPKYCCGIRHSTCVGFWQAIAVVFIILTLIVVGATVILVVQRDSIHRVCGIASANDIVDGPIVETDARFIYKVIFNGDGNSIEYRVRWNASQVSPITAIRIRGPMEPNSWIGPIAGSLCGAPLAVACSIATEGGETSGVVRHTIQNGIVPAGVDVRTVTEPFRRDPELYYLEILTTSAFESPGAARSQLTNTCGYP